MAWQRQQPQSASGELPTGPEEKLSRWAVLPCFVQLDPRSAELHWMGSFPVSFTPFHLHNLFGLCAYQTHSEATTFIPYSFTHFQLQAEIFPLWEQALCKDAPDLETHFNAASSFGLKKTKTKTTTTKTKPEKAGLVFQKDSFKVAKQNESINAESQFTKREAKMGEAVSSGLTNSL